MMKHEFERIAGYEVSWTDYNNIIEPMYMATNLTKEDFVKTLDKKRFALKPRSWYVKQMKEIAQHLKKTCEHYTDYEAVDKLKALADEWLARKQGYGYNIDTRYTYEHLGNGRGCTYPIGIEFYSKEYARVDYIELV